MTNVSFDVLNGTGIKTFKTFKEAKAYKKANGGVIKTVYTELQDSYYNGAESESKIIRRTLV